MKALVALLLCIPTCSTVSYAATFVRIACGGPGGVVGDVVWQKDAFYLGGAAWSPSTGLAVPYNNMRFCATCSYLFKLQQGNYRVKFGFTEPIKTGPGQRLFSVSVNDTLVVDNLDVFAAAGGMKKPYDVTYDVAAPDGLIAIVLKSQVGGKAVISSIEITDAVVPAPRPAPITPPQGVASNTQYLLQYTAPSTSPCVTLGPNGVAMEGTVSQ